MFHIMKKKKADVDIKFKFIKSYLKDDVDFIKQKHEEGFDIKNMFDNNEYDLLSLCIYDGKVNLIEFLLENCYEITDSSYLRQAAFIDGEHSFDILKMILNKSLKYINEKQRVGNDEEHILYERILYARWQEEKCLSVIDLLIKNGAFVNENNKDGKSLLEMVKETLGEDSPYVEKFKKVLEQNV